MLQKSLTHLLILCYSVPALLGHGGLHAVFGVTHNCSHQHSLEQNSDDVLEEDQYITVFDANDHLASDCCDHSAKQVEQQESRPDSPPSQHPVDEENCKLCQHTSQGQIESPEIRLQSLSAIAASELLFECAFESHVDSIHVPRGPPLFC